MWIVTLTSYLPDWLPGESYSEPGLWPGLACAVMLDCWNQWLMPSPIGWVNYCHLSITNINNVTPSDNLYIPHISVASRVQAWHIPDGSICKYTTPHSWQYGCCYGGLSQYGGSKFTSDSWLTRIDSWACWVGGCGSCRIFIQIPVLFSVKSYKLLHTTRADVHHCEEIREVKQQTWVVEKAKVDRYSYRNFLNIVY